MFEMHVPIGSGMPVPHHHIGFDEVVYAKGRQTANNRRGSGQSLLIKCGEIHAFANPFGEIAKVLWVLMPCILGVQYFREVRELLTTGGRPDSAKMGAIMMRRGLEPAKPA